MNKYERKLVEAVVGWVDAKRSFREWHNHMSDSDSTVLEANMKFEQQEVLRAAENLVKHLPGSLLNQYEPTIRRVRC